MRNTKKSRTLEVIRAIKPSYIETPVDVIYFRYRHYGMSMRQAIYTPYFGNKNVRLFFPNRFDNNLFLYIDV